MGYHTALEHVGIGTTILLTSLLSIVSQFNIASLAFIGF